MKKKVKHILPALALICALALIASCSDSHQKPNAEQALKRLELGNKRFVEGKSQFPHMDKSRLAQAGTEDQGDHAFATVISCSDSRVPVELIFDAGIMDLFVIRVAGNVCDTDEAGSIEYGLAHVNTPVLVVLGHTQCGAVTAVTQAMKGKGHALERNIPPLVDNIGPSVKRTMDLNPKLPASAIIPIAIEENVWTTMYDLFVTSPSTRELVKSGKVKAVGAIYDVGTGEVNWLAQEKTEMMLALAEASPDKAVNPMAEDH